MADKLKVSYWVDIGLLLAIIVSAITGLIKWSGLIRIGGIRHVILPPGIVTALHDWSGLFLALFALVHIILHWKWIVSKTRDFFRKKKTDEKSKLDK